MNNFAFVTSGTLMLQYIWWLRYVTYRLKAKPMSPTCGDDEVPCVWHIITQDFLMCIPGYKSLCNKLFVTLTQQCGGALLGYDIWYEVHHDIKMKRIIGTSPDFFLTFREIHLLIPGVCRMPAVDRGCIERHCRPCNCEDVGTT